MANGVAISNQTPPSPPTQPRRVKVYELKNNDWFDRGTGYCTGHLMNVRRDLGPEEAWTCAVLGLLLTWNMQEVPHIQVKSEEEQDRLLLETKIIRDDGYQKQQGEWILLWAVCRTS